MTTTPPIPSAEERPRVTERLRRMVQRYAEVSPYRLNPDASVVEGIVQGLVRSTMRYGLGYCPCRDLTGNAAVDRANICPCAYHQEEIARDKHCRCQLFVGEGYDPAVAYQAPVRVLSAAPGSSVRQREVTMYCTGWCFLSRRTRAWLDGEGVAYTIVDIDTDEDAARRVERWNNGFRSVPTLEIHQILVEPATAELQRMLLDSQATLAGLTIYSRETCPDCRTVLGWLDAHAVQYEYVDVLQDAAAVERIAAWNGSVARVPTLDLVLRLTEPPTDRLAAALGL